MKNTQGTYEGLCFDENCQRTHNSDPATGLCDLYTSAEGMRHTDERSITMFERVVILLTALAIGLTGWYIFSVLDRLSAGNPIGF